MTGSASQPSGGRSTLAVEDHRSVAFVSGALELFVAAFFRHSNGCQILRMDNANRPYRPKVCVSPSHCRTDGLRRIALAVCFGCEHPAQLRYSLERRLQVAFE